MKFPCHSLTIVLAIAAVAGIFATGNGCKCGGKKTIELAEYTKELENGANSDVAKPELVISAKEAKILSNEPDSLITCVEAGTYQIYDTHMAHTADKCLVVKDVFANSYFANAKIDVKRKAEMRRKWDLMASASMAVVPEKVAKPISIHSNFRLRFVMTDSNNNNFKLIELLAYCRREIAQKDKEIHRLQEAIEHAQIVHERKLLSELSKVERKFAEELRCAQQNALELQLSTSQDVVTRRMDEKFGGTNLPTFDGNGIERMENAKSAIAWNDDVQRINMLLKERELVITTTDKVRNELEVEFADKLEHAKRQLQLEHAAQWEADQLMATKMKKEIADLAKQLAECGERSAKSIEELESRLQQSELEKSKLATIVQRGKMQTEKAMAEQRRQAQIATSKQEATIRGLNKQIEQCKVEKEELNRTVVEMKHQNQELNEKYSDEKARSQKIHREHSKLVGKLKELLGFLEKINTTKQIDQPSQVQMAIAVENENDDDDQRDRATVFARIYSILEAVKFD